MAEKTIVVCDVCGDPAVESPVLTIGSQRLRRDYCKTHLAELVKGWRSAGRGRGRPRGSKSKAKSTVTAKSTRARRRARTPSPRAIGADVAAEVKKLKADGMSYPQIGRTLMERGIKPPRAKRWNPVVLGRLVQRPTTS